MITNDPNIIVGSSGLLSVEVLEGNSIKITLKNKSTLELIPEIADNKVVGYKMEFLTSQENRKIEKMKEKIKQMEEEILKMKVSGIEGEEEGEEDEDEENEDVEE